MQSVYINQEGKRQIVPYLFLSDIISHFKEKWAKDVKRLFILEISCSCENIQLSNYQRNAKSHKKMLLFIFGLAHFKKNMSTIEYVRTKYCHTPLVRESFP